MTRRGVYLHGGLLFILRFTFYLTQDLVGQTSVIRLKQNLENRVYRIKGQKLL